MFPSYICLDKDDFFVSTFGGSPSQDDIVFPSKIYPLNDPFSYHNESTTKKKYTYTPVN